MESTILEGPQASWAADADDDSDNAAAIVGDANDHHHD